MAEIIKNNTEHFKKFCNMIKNLLELNDSEIISDMREASLDDSCKNKTFYLYSNKDNLLNMTVVKLDSITQHFFHYMKQKRKLINFQQTQAVDAVCINQNNEWFFIEFKNKEYEKDTIADIKKKIFKSLWFVFSMDSINKANLFNDSDFTDFARQHITYIIVVSREKNTEEYRRLSESYKRRYTPNEFKKYVGYYLKDVFLFTENELCTFIKNFN